jgi:CubicO group peptidase (beta-lactamase class C family)
LWKYQCINSVILGQIIEKASGLSLAKFTQKYLWQQINATSEAFWWQDQNHIIKAFCCFFATARDYAKIAITVLQGGKYFHNYVVTPQYISQMFTPNLHLKNKYGDTVNYFGLHAWLTYYKGLRINYFRGMYGQYIILIPQKNAAIIHLGFKQVPPSRKHLPQDFKDYLAIGLDILNQSNYSAM